MGQNRGREITNKAAVVIRGDIDMNQVNAGASIGDIKDGMDD